MPDSPLGGALRQHFDDRIPVIPLEEVEARAAIAPVRTPHRRRNVLAAAAIIALLFTAGGLAVRTVVDRSPEDVVAGPANDAWCAALAAPAYAGTPLVVSLTPEANAATIDDVGARLLSEPGVEAVRLYGADVAWARARQLFADQPHALDLLRPEDVPGYFLVLHEDSAAADALQERSNGWPGVHAITVTVVPPRKPPPDAGVPIDDLMVDQVAGLAEGLPTYADATARTAMRTSAPTDIASEVDVVDSLLDLGQPARTPSPADRAAATTVLDQAEDRCDLRPR